MDQKEIMLHTVAVNHENDTCVTTTHTNNYTLKQMDILHLLRLPGTHDAKIDENQTPLTRFPQ